MALHIVCAAAPSWPCGTMTELPDMMQQQGTMSLRPAHLAVGRVAQVEDGVDLDVLAEGGQPPDVAVLHHVQQHAVVLLVADCMSSHNGVSAVARAKLSDCWDGFRSCAFCKAFAMEVGRPTHRCPSR